MRPSIRRSRCLSIRALATKLLAASGYSKEKPVKFTIQTTRGFKPKDYEMIQAIVGMWRNVGIDANIEVYEVAKHFESSHRPTNSRRRPSTTGEHIGDPTTSTGFAMWSKSPHSAWHSERSRRQDHPALGREGRGKAHPGLEGCGPLYRRAGLCAAAAAIRAADSHKSDLKVTHNTSGALLPASLIEKA